ncbi:Translational activator GCN1 [Trichinella pseudospiralis]|uniref:Translational activator GCN1 n=1 Tax=Trichinella pseudospiralis TaxID=6337 RepID=A0A0V1IPC0_TRIPS|nr:Translational activator GCN1 [Trichinella pseudospiralis]
MATTHKNNVKPIAHKTGNVINSEIVSLKSSFQLMHYDIYEALLSRAIFSDRKDVKFNTIQALSQILKGRQVNVFRYVSRVITRLMEPFTQNPSHSIRHAAITALHVLKVVFPTKKNIIPAESHRHFMKYLKSIGICCYLIITCGDIRFYRSALRKIFYMMKQSSIPTNIFVKGITAEGEVDLSLVFVMLYDLRFETEFRGWMEDALNGYVRIVLQVPDGAEIEVLNCWKSVMSKVTLKEFEEYLLPQLIHGMKKHIRSTIKAYAYLFDQLKIDLSEFVYDLLPSLIHYICSKDELMKQYSISAVSALVKRLEKTEAKQTALSGVLGLITDRPPIANTIDGKLAVLECVRKSSESLPENSKEYFWNVILRLIGLIRTEVHDEVQKQCLKAISKWTADSWNLSLPNELLQLFEEFGKRWNTAANSLSYMECISSCYSRRGFKKNSKLAGLLVKIIETNMNLMNQPKRVLEAAYACKVLLHHVSLKFDTEMTKVIYWIKEKHEFTSNKWWSSNDFDVWMTVMSCIEMVIVQSFDEISKRSLDEYCRAFLCLLTHSDYKIRRNAEECLYRLYDKPIGPNLAVQLLKTFSSTLSSEMFVHYMNKKQDSMTVDSSAENRISRILATVVVKLCCRNFSPSIQLIIQALICLSRPDILDVAPKFWDSILKFYNFTPADYVREHHVQLCTLALRAEQKHAAEIAKQIFTRCDMHVFRDLLHKSAEMALDETVMQASIEAIDKSKTSNVDEESQYSWKSVFSKSSSGKQAKHATKEGSSKTKKSFQSKQERRVGLSKEGGIQVDNDHGADLDKLLMNSVHGLDLIRAAIESNSPHLKRNVQKIVETLLKVLQCELLSSKAVDCWLSLVTRMFPKSEHVLAFRCAHATLRLLNCCAPLDKQWTEESAISQGRGVVEKLHAAVFCGSDDDDCDSLTESYAALPLTMSVFAVCFPLVKQMILMMLNDEKEEDFVCSLLSFIEIQVDKKAHKCQVFEEENLPASEIFELMCDNICIASSFKVRQLGASCLYNTVEQLAEGNRLPDIDAAVVKMIQLVLDKMFTTIDYAVKEIFLKSLQIALCIVEVDSLSDEILTKLYALKFDMNESVASLANMIWESSRLELQPNSLHVFTEMLNNPNGEIRAMVATAICNAMKSGVYPLAVLLDHLNEIYDQLADKASSLTDDFGRVIDDELPNTVFSLKMGIASSLLRLSSLIKENDLPKLLNAISARALNDNFGEVRFAMLNAAIEAVKLHGKNHVNFIFEKIENLLNCPNDAAHDPLRMAAVILSGSVAQHLDKDDGRVQMVFVRLIENLSIPSQDVQETIASCLPPLVPSVYREVPNVIRNFLQLLFSNANYGERRGAAYGIAGLVKGMGILSLKKLHIVSELQDAIADKGSARRREGAVICLEVLSTILRKVFEPYMLLLTSNLLFCLGDVDRHVRQAANDCAKIWMKNLTPHTMNMLLPRILDGLNADSWRTKCGSIDMLRAMAYCAPKQLSISLPQIVPNLVELLFETHELVQQSAVQALSTVAKVIKNPEILNISDSLLVALENPERTENCLKQLVHTRFVHYVDAPSLALVMPVLTRAFEDRSSETRRMAALVMGNIYHLTGNEEVNPYLQSILPGVKKNLLDPIPEVRNVTARAMGLMVKAAGKEKFADLLEWLRGMVVCKSSGINREGAAQGLSEVIGAIGEDYLEVIMPQLFDVSTSAGAEAHVRDGFMNLFVYLPMVFGNKFLPYLDTVISIILKALADESEFLRESALRAGKRIVHLYSTTATTKLLPSLEEGIYNSNWRIRLSSLQLLGELLFKIIGVSGKMTTVGFEEETFGTALSFQSIRQKLGSEHSDRIFSGIYITRFDELTSVRNMASHIWKVVVVNTVQTLSEIMSTLFLQLLNCIGSSCVDLQKMSSNCMGSLVGTVGDRVFYDIVPILERDFSNEGAEQRHGVCLALSQIMQNTNRETVAPYAQRLFPTVLRAMCDEVPEVREAASEAFVSLYLSTGPKIVPFLARPLMENMSNPSTRSYFLDSLQQVMNTRGRVLLIHFIPNLCSMPSNSEAIGKLFSRAPDILAQYLHQVLKAMFSSLMVSHGHNTLDITLEHFALIVGAIHNKVSMDQAFRFVHEKLNIREKRKCYISAVMFSALCSHAQLPISEFGGEMIACGLSFYKLDNENILHIIGNSIGECFRKLDSDQSLELLPSLARPLLSLINEMELGDSSSAGGLCSELTVSPIVSMLRSCLISGGSEVRRQLCVELLFKMVAVCSESSLHPSGVMLVGAMIRTLGERHANSIRTPLFQCLLALLIKIPTVMKCFAPQLQNLFLRLLNEQSSCAIRLIAAQGFGELSKLAERRNLVLQSLLNSLGTVEQPELKEAHLIGIRCVLLNAIGNQLDAEIASKIHQAVLTKVVSSDEGHRVACASLLSVLMCHFCTDKELFFTLNRMTSFQNYQQASDDENHFTGTLIMLILKIDAQKLFQQLSKPVYNFLLLLIGSSSITLMDTGLRAITYLLIYQMKNSIEPDDVVVNGLLYALKHDNSDIRKTCANLISYISHEIEEIPLALFKAFVIAMLCTVKDKNSAVRCASEACLVHLLGVREDGTTKFMERLVGLDGYQQQSLKNVIFRYKERSEDESWKIIDDIDYSYKLNLCKKYF